MARFIVAFLLAFTIAAHAETAPRSQPPMTAQTPRDEPGDPVGDLKVTEVVNALKTAMLAPGVSKLISEKTSSEKIARAWTEATNKALDADKINNAIRDDAAQTFRAEDIEWYRTFYASDLGQKLLKLAKYQKKQAQSGLDAGSPMDLLDAKRAELDEDPVRARALERLVAALGGADLYIDTLLAIGTSAINAVKTVAPKAQSGMGLDTQQIAVMVETYRPMLRMAIAQAIVPALAVAYEPLANKEIDALAAAIETPSGQRLTAGMTAVTRRAIERIIADFTNQIALEMKSEPL